MQGFCAGATGNRAWVGGAFRLKAKADVLSLRALDLKRAIEKKKKAAEPVAKAS